MSKGKRSVEQELLKVEAKDKVNIGIDLGNGYSKVVASHNNKIIDYVMPSGFLYEKDVLTDDLGLGSVKNNRYFIMSENNPDPIVHIWNKNSNGNQHFQTLMGNENRYTKTSFSIFTSITLHKVADMLEIKNKNEVEFYITTGVPSDQKGTILEEQIRDSFYNSPKISANGEVFEPNVKEVLVLAQATGTMLDSRLDQNGFNFKDIDIEFEGVIDIGTMTSDGEIIQDFTPILSQRFSVNSGMYDVYNKIAEHIREVTGSRPVFTEIEKQFNMDEFKRGMNYYPIKKVREEAIREVYEKIKSTVESKWTQMSYVEKITLTGGGATLFAPLFEKEGYKVNVADNNQMSNVLGFYKYGINMFSGIFEEVKK